MQRESFSIDNIRLSVAKTGHGRPFVFQHGLTGAADQTAAVFPADLNWQLHTMECRGHGESECGKLSLLSITQFTDDLAAYITSLNVGPVTVGGISMGAAIALRMAVKHPQLVGGLVLARPAWISETAPENLASIREVAQLLSEHDPAQAKLLFENSKIATQLMRDAPDNLTSLLNVFDRTPHAETQALMAAIAGDGPDISRNEIAKIDFRTLVIGTTQDAIHPLSMAEELAGLIPAAQMVELSSKSANLHEHQAEFLSALNHFLQELE